MSIQEKKQVLHNIIDKADEKLTGLMIALASEYNESEEQYSEEEIKEFYKTGDEMLAHPETTFTVKEAHEQIRNKKR